MKPAPTLGLLLLTLVACRQEITPQLQARIDSLTTAAQERDRLVQEVSENARTLSDISVELAKVRVPTRELRGNSESPLAAARDSMVRRVRYITARVNALEPRLRDSQRRVRDLTTVSDSLRAALDSTMTNLQAVIESQRSQIASLTEQVVLLTGEKVALQDTLMTVRSEQDRVYYVVGTKEELIERGVLVEEGGARFLFVLWRSGSTLSPARELDPAVFTPISKAGTTAIPLPDPSREYRIASRHPTKFVEPHEGDRIRGTTQLTITDRERFWKPSRYLIVVTS